MQFYDPHLYRYIDGWHSPRLGMHMPIVTYGHAGHPLLLFPTAQADFLEYERWLMIKVLEPHLFAGRVRVYSIDSINKHAWMNKSVSIPECARRQALYMGYVEEEVVPYIRHHSNGQRICTSGASWGAFHAANALFRRPDLFDSTVAMSGFYDLEPLYTKGYKSDEVYFNNPVAYLSNMAEGGTLDLLRHACQIHILTGQGAYEAPKKSEQLSEVLWQKGIWHNLDKWGHDVDH
ncbi:MAG: hypothetical protein IT373_24780, partial [Polyangiaceae bacterium]|nr:hypothetical protein [Polyangiaceae bacterium]